MLFIKQTHNYYFCDTDKCEFFKKNPQKELIT